MKKWIYSAGICILGMAMLTGCGDGSTESGVPTQATSMTPEPVRSDTEVSTLNYEAKYSSGEFSMEDYHALAALYGEQGLIQKQRDMLEGSYRLYDDKEAFELLQDITVNVEEEEEELRAEVQLALQNLETPGYFAETIHQIESPEWFELMMPKLKEGVRNYYLEEDGEVKLILRAGHDEEGNSFSILWYHGGEDGIWVLKHSGGMVQILSTSLEDGLYEGAFTLWILDGAGGSILKEQGTFAQGIYTGEYTLDIYEGSASGDPYDLWNNRDSMEYVSYKGQADEEGMGELQQFALNLEPYPEFETYSIKTAGEAGGQEGAAGENAAEAPLIRIFDGELQWFDGQLWQTLGTAKQYQEADPFYAYVQQRQLKKEGANTGGGISGGLDLESIQKPEPAVASTATPAQKPAASTPKPGATPPASTPKPTPAPTPAPQPTPTPVEEPDDDDDDGSDSGSSDSGSSDSGSSDSGSSDSGSSDGGSSDSGSGDDGNNDADVEWTPDIM